MKFLTHDGVLYFWGKIKNYIDTKYNELFQSVSNGKKTVANAITDKGVSTSETATFATMATNISKITTGIETSDATAVDSEILSGKTAYAKGSKLTGTMINRGAVNQSLAINGTYTIPAGYHNGSGKVTQSITTKGAATITPGTTNQTISAGQYLSGAQTILGDANLISANILSGKSIFGVSGTATQGRKFATGSTKVYPLDTIRIVAADGTYMDGFREISDWLSFKPSIILAYKSYSDASSFNPAAVLYTSFADGSSTIETCKTFRFNKTEFSGWVYNFAVNQTYTDIKVTSSQFVLPISGANFNDTYTWYAWE